MSIAERMESGFKRPEAGREQPAGEGGEKGSVGHVAIHKHEDGGYHTEDHEGKREEHPDLTHALAHAAGHHEPGEKHSVFAHHEDGSHTSSHHEGGGSVTGPEEHNSADEAKGALDKFLGEEAQEPQHQQGGYKSMFEGQE